MAEQAKVTITIDPAQARKEVARLEDAPGSPEARLKRVEKEQQRAEKPEKKGTTFQRFRQVGGIASKVALAGAAVVGTAALVEQIAPIVRGIVDGAVNEATKPINDAVNGILEKFGVDPIDIGDPIKDATGAVEEATVNFAQNITRGGQAAIQTLGDVKSIAAGMALTGQDADPGAAVSLAKSLFQVNFFSARMEAEISEATRIELSERVTEFITKKIKELFQSGG